MDFQPSAHRAHNLELIRAELSAITSVQDNFDQVSTLLYRTADENGFHNGDWNDAEKIALMHSEVSEAHDAHRIGAFDDKLPDVPGAVAEMADTVIRIMDYSKHKGYDLQPYVQDALVDELDSLTSQGSPELIDIHSALSLALEEIRKGNDGLIEFATVVARCFIWSEIEYEHHSLDAVIITKGVYNTTRPFMHGKKF